MASTKIRFCSYPGCGYSTVDNKAFQEHLNATGHRNTKGGWIGHVATSSGVVVSPSPPTYQSTASGGGSYQSQQVAMAAHLVQPPYHYTVSPPVPPQVYQPVVSASAPVPTRSGMTTTTMVPAMPAGSSSLATAAPASSYPVVSAVPMSAPMSTGMNGAGVMVTIPPVTVGMPPVTAGSSASMVATQQVGESKQVETKVRYTTAKVEEQPWINAGIIVDVSGSMHGQKLDIAREACEHIAVTLRRSDSLVIKSFADTVMEVYRRGKDTPVDKSSLRSTIHANLSYTRGGTAIYAAILDYAREYASNSGGLKKVVVITDGESTEPDAEALLARCVDFLRSKLAAKHKFWFSLIEVGCTCRTRLGMAIDAINAERAHQKKGGKGGKAKQRIRVDTLEDTEAGIKKMFKLATTRILKNVKEVERTVSTVRVASAAKKAALVSHPQQQQQQPPLVGYPHSGNGAVAARGYANAVAPTSAPTAAFLPVYTTPHIASTTSHVYARSHHGYTTNNRRHPHRPQTAKVGGGGRGRGNK